ncbi:MAG: GWxTD domain-containing protein [Bacteroidetes bacterium]|nr:GWxTD domain-containing protein [Bacteroidota bacterium]
MGIRGGLITLLFSAVSLFAQTKLEFEFDYARFNLDSVSSQLEIYYSIGQTKLTVVEIEGKQSVSANINLIITNKETRQVLVDKKYKINSNVELINNELTRKNLIGAMTFRLPIGNYFLEFSVEDGVDSTISKYLNEEINIKKPDPKLISISDLEFASRIVVESNDVNSIFYKNTMEVIPNPQNIYGQNMPMLFYYAELYNLADDTTKSSLILNSQVINNFGKKVYEKTKDISKNNNAIVEVGAVNISNFPTGTYTLYLNLIGTEKSKGVSSFKRFYVINPHVKDTVSNFKSDMNVLTSEYGVMGVEECDELFSCIRYIATSKEMDSYKSLDSLNAKREFLFKFFLARDTNPETTENEFKREFDERIKTVNAKYRTFTKKGTRTDRGRIYLIYGEPDEIDMHPNDYDRKPYEIWYYHSIEGGVTFVFGDLSGYSDYELLHSTKRGELRDDNWERRITAN